MSELLRAEGDYIPRLTSDGMQGNPYWYSRNPFYLAGVGLPNCTCYAWGRFWENADVNGDFSNRPNLSTGNAQDWFNYNDSYQRGNIPELGAIACYSGGDFSGLGHVCVIEEIHEDYCVTSNSAWNGQYFYLVNIALNGAYPYGHYHFQGFIYNPYSGGGGGWTFRKKPWLWKRELYKREDSLLR